MTFSSLNFAGGTYTSGVAKVETASLLSPSPSPSSSSSSPPSSDSQLYAPLHPSPLPLSPSPSPSPPNGIYEFGVEVTSAPAPFWRTKLVTIKPHVLLVNLTPLPLLCSQSLGFSPLSSSDPPPHPVLNLLPGEEKPFHWSFRPPADIQNLLQISLQEGTEVTSLMKEGEDSTASWKWSWSSGFPILDGVTRFEVCLLSFLQSKLFFFFPPFFSHFFPF